MRSENLQDGASMAIYTQLWQGTVPSLFPREFPFLQLVPIACLLSQKQPRVIFRVLSESERLLLDPFSSSKNPLPASHQFLQHNFCPASPLWREHTRMKNLCQQPWGRSQHFFHLIGRNRKTTDSSNASFPCFIFSDNTQDNLRRNKSPAYEHLLAREEHKGNDLQMKPKCTAHPSGWWLMDVQWWLLQRKEAWGKI